jgi:hypothetical protein
MSAAFLSRFENKISVVHRDGTVRKVGSDAEGSPVDEPAAILGANMHPALANALVGSCTTTGAPRSAAPPGTGGAREQRVPPPVASPQPRRAQPPRESVAAAPPPVPSQQRRVLAKPSAAELQAMLRPRTRWPSFPAPLSRDASTSAGCAAHPRPTHPPALP